MRKTIQRFGNLQMIKIEPFFNKRQTHQLTLLYRAVLTLMPRASQSVLCPILFANLKRYSMVGQVFYLTDLPNICVADFKELFWMALPHSGHRSPQVSLNGASCRARALSNDPPDFICEGTQATDLKCFHLKMQGHIRHT